ncbi:sister chromatid cohesion protein 1 [Fusarium torreyae]|uniref:Sister chromatid cohesion protein 1 n=1 Tax=Fusarium torreyae TaxID=1237075 RepID=A0A9W8VNJ4_9HYPO|nr:sister chromatid cohesion protein 1 [Fusarium torreyae]
MFYSETLLQKSGPLARVWLSANLERKLSKNHILQSNVTDSVEAIITPNQAPMALRLSSQLLLGVVRIYQRKTRYLLDDCNEAMMKIKMAFRSSGNNDMAVSLQLPNREALTLPDKITPYDNFELPPPPDANWLLSQVEDVSAAPIGRKGRVSQRDINLQEDYDNSQFLNDGMGMDDDMMAPLGNIDLELDFGLDDLGLEETALEPEGGRRERTTVGPEFDDSDLALPSKEGQDIAMTLDLPEGGPLVHDGDDIEMGEGIGFNPDDISQVTGMAGPDILPPRISESPLSDIDEEMERQIAERVEMGEIYDQPADDGEHEVARQPAQRAKKQKILTPDEEIALSSNHIKQQQANRDNIIKDAGFLPRDPFLLALMDMQKSGGFVSSIMMEGRSSAWAPELRGMLSLDTARGMNELKRKRDSGIADVESDHGASKSPRILDIGEDTGLGFEGGFGEMSIPPEESRHEIPAEEEEPGSPMPGFEDTTMAPVHPAESGPVSQVTKHVVHQLRDRFGDDAADSPGKRTERAVLFQTLCPRQETTKADATKMFFECLVLATKDAIKVEQGSGLGDDIRIRAKRGLWGAWAEREAGGEMSQENDTPNEPEPAAVVTPAVTVSA